MYMAGARRQRGSSAVPALTSAALGEMQLHKQQSLNETGSTTICRRAGGGSSQHINKKEKEE
jgi:hypothetical protein